MHQCLTWTLQNVLVLCILAICILMNQLKGSVQWLYNVIFRKETIKITWHNLFYYITITFHSLTLKSKYNLLLLTFWCYQIQILNDFWKRTSNNILTEFASQNYVGKHLFCLKKIKIKCFCKMFINFFIILFPT